MPSTTSSTQSMKPTTDLRQKPKTPNAECLVETKSLQAQALYLQLLRTEMLRSQELRLILQTGGTSVNGMRGFEPQEKKP